MMSTPRPYRLLCILTENWTMTSPRDLPALVRMAVEAEAAGFDAVMMSEHVVLGPSAIELGPPANPREYAGPGNQDPDMAWPSSLLMLAAVAAATSRVRLIAGAIIAPLRHPVLLAKDLATLDVLSQGRLVVQPTVSWHRDEYDALGVDFDRRGALLDQHLEAWHALWGPSPASYEGADYRFAGVHLEPKPWHAGGPAMWFGGQHLHGPLLRRLVRYGSGFHPFGSPSPDDLRRLDDALVTAGRDPDSLERIGGTRAVFPRPDAPADLRAAIASFPDQLAAGFTTFCMKPSQFVDSLDEHADLCHRFVAEVDHLLGP